MLQLQPHTSVHLSSPSSSLSYSHKSTGLRHTSAYKWNHMLISLTFKFTSVWQRAACDVCYCPFKHGGAVGSELWTVHTGVSYWQCLKKNHVFAPRLAVWTQPTKHSRSLKCNQTTQTTPLENTALTNRSQTLLEFILCYLLSFDIDL